MSECEPTDSGQDAARKSLSPRVVWSCVISLLAIHAGLLAYSATRHSPTLNEPGHLVAGLSYWKFGRFELYRVNPPLVEMIAALPVMVAGYEEDWSGFYESPGARPVFGMGSDFIKANGTRSIWLFTIARWVCIPISLIGGLFCFLWSRELWRVIDPNPMREQGVPPDRSRIRQNSVPTQPAAPHASNRDMPHANLAGLFSLTLWCFEPNILAHGELITPDCAATSFGLGAGYFFWRWLRQPTWSRAFAAGALLGLAELSKMTWVVLFALWPILWLFYRATRAQSFSPAGEKVAEGRMRARAMGLWSLASRGCQPADNPGADKSTDESSATEQIGGLTPPRSPGRRRCLLQLAAILLIGLYLLNLGYAFDGSFTRLKDFTFISSALTGLEKSGDPGNRFADSFLGEIPVPVPKQYFEGKCDCVDDARDTSHCYTEYDCVWDPDTQLCIADPTTEDKKFKPVKSASNCSTF